MHSAKHVHNLTPKRRQTRRPGYVQTIIVANYECVRTSSKHVPYCSARRRAEPTQATQATQKPLRVDVTLVEDAVIVALVAAFSSLVIVGARSLIDAFCVRIRRFYAGVRVSMLVCVCDSPIVETRTQPAHDNDKHNAVTLCWQAGSVGFGGLLLLWLLRHRRPLIE